MPKQKRVPAMESDGRDIEFSMEMADEDDLEALERSKAADARMKQKGPMKKQ